tara:strand:- start:120 stop:1460 length:1341 start_codon:yes stop_codon:yes gene_type:complete
MRIQADKNKAFTFLNGASLLQSLKTLVASVYTLTIWLLLNLAKTIIRIITFGQMSFKERKHSIYSPFLYCQATVSQADPKKSQSKSTFELQETHKGVNNQPAVTPTRDQEVRSTIRIQSIFRGNRVRNEFSWEIYRLLKDKIHKLTELHEAVRLISFLKSSKPIFPNKFLYKAKNGKTWAYFPMTRPEALVKQSCEIKNIGADYTNHITLLHQIQQFYAFTTDITGEDTDAIKSTCMYKLAGLLHTYLVTLDTATRKAHLQKSQQESAEYRKVRKATYNAYAHHLARCIDFIKYTTKKEIRSKINIRLFYEDKQRPLSGGELNRMLCQDEAKFDKNLNKLLANFLTKNWLQKEVIQKIREIANSINTTDQKYYTPQVHTIPSPNADTDATTRLSQYMSKFGESISKLATPDSFKLATPVSLDPVIEEVDPSPDTSGRSTPTSLIHM